MFLGKPSGDFRVIVLLNVEKASLNFASVSMVGYCVLFVMLSTNIEKNSAVSEEGDVLTAYGFFLVVSLASMQFKSF